MRLKGFTLVELLVTIAIIGILVATSLAQYSEYKKKVYDSALISDARNMMLGAEALLADRIAQTGQLECADVSCEELLPGFQYSAGNCGYLYLNLTDNPNPFATNSKFYGAIYSNYTSTDGHGYFLDFSSDPLIEGSLINDAESRWISHNMRFYNTNGLSGEQWWSDCE